MVPRWLSINARLLDTRPCLHSISLAYKNEESMFVTNVSLYRCIWERKRWKERERESKLESMAIRKPRSRLNNREDFPLGLLPVRETISLDARGTRPRRNFNSCLNDE